MEHHQAEDAGIILQTWRVFVNIMNKELWIANME
jgi:hypothetical protein